VIRILVFSHLPALRSFFPCTIQAQRNSLAARKLSSFRLPLE
jgi:hypothetical protein